jgi:hypothetical protein
MPREPLPTTFCPAIALTLCAARTPATEASGGGGWRRGGFADTEELVAREGVERVDALRRLVPVVRPGIALGHRAAVAAHLRFTVGFARADFVDGGLLVVRRQTAEELLTLDRIEALALASGIGPAVAAAAAAAAAGGERLGRARRSLYSVSGRGSRAMP